MLQNNTLAWARPSWKQQTQRLLTPLTCCRQPLRYSHLQRTVSPHSAKISSHDSGSGCADWHTLSLFTVAFRATGAKLCGLRTDQPSSQLRSNWRMLLSFKAMIHTVTLTRIDNAWRYRYNRLGLAPDMWFSVMR